MTGTVATIEESGLIYLTDNDPGIYRKGNPGKFHYEDNHGNKLTEETLLARINALVIPPAWTNVWICPKKNGYLQAVGTDAAGRKQYRYHVKWTSRRSDQKYFRLLEFGKALPKARRIIRNDLNRKKYDERKVLAICLEVMQKTLIRIGNRSYKELYGTYGLSTLRDKHVKINGSHLTLDFVGKKGVKHSVKYTDRRLSRLVKKCRDIPGQELFQYFTEDGHHKSVGSEQINNYIREITNNDFTAKDFRTWGGSLEAFRQLAICSRREDSIPKKKLVVEVLDCVAQKLGNTRAVCKSSYVYPALLKTFEDGELGRYFQKFRLSDEYTETTRKNNERLFMRFLKDYDKRK